ncbi:PTS fructose transporter subunit IIC [Streptococcus pneumoniae]|uniref:PTS system transporter subunit IIC n=1 Tax=Streptococcus pneumoniae TaxID=1313 RepID=A0A4J1YZA2_STREE|nr:PTS fructose transporter subunit IIC [Streptococcus pneumoniae]UKP54607.1 PTS fructose transporter subunit IIC [Streptococcus pneumoniae]VMZ48246.1 PTS system transporter subunit IIC [Streptococcus pneumoniae]VNP98960.1 PTS system transporter subunit IIC [Streptococcus pneumoniae]HET0017422.1 PTS fructose transporter subunit IIC [Streptococcus pneumoniae]
MLKHLNLKGHLLTAISYMIPIVCGAGFLVAIGLAMGGGVPDALVAGKFTIWDALATMGGKALGLLPVVIATGLSYSIAGKPGIAPGFVVGLIANSVGSGFIGGILGGYIAGFLVQAIIKKVKVPNWIKGLMPTLIIPFVASLVSSLIMIYIIGAPIAAFTNWLTSLLQSLGSASNGLMGAVIGVLSAVDFGGPLNKTVYAFVLTLQAEGVKEPLTALQLVNTATPVGFGLAYFIAKLLKKNIYTQEEIETLKSAVPMGIVNIVEGVIPIVMNNLVPGLIATGIGGAVSLTMGADSAVPFGGVLMLPTMTRPVAGICALLANIVVTGLVYAILRKPIKHTEPVMTVEEEIDLSDIEIL